MKSILKQKSEFNLDAGIKLINEYLYAPSVHCLYYSCFQLMKVIIHEYDGIKYEDFEKKDAHEFVIHKIITHLNGIDKKEYLEFNRIIKELKKLRTEADYDESEILIDKAETARRHSNYIRNKLIKTFNQ